ncbi:RNA-directed DNA polymerase, eukaryota, reverse transcriptase zinc-binding domain protein [Tanacetum coccineum]
MQTNRSWSMLDLSLMTAVFLPGISSGQFNSTTYERCNEQGTDACVTTAGFTLNVNGERISYFKGGRDLRQGDPVSPYLFTLIMEVFSLMLKRQNENDTKFQYHFGCKSMQLVHVCFTDDLLVMCHGDADSVNVIKKALDEFSTCSGLLPNNSKIRYSGVPLIAKRLSVKECGCRLDKIENRAFVFLLPTTVINEINKLLKGFLWNQGDTAKGKAKVAWTAIYRPKNQGGLGLKNLQTWNQALLAKNIWNIATKKDNL